LDAGRKVTATEGMAQTENLPTGWERLREKGASATSVKEDGGGVSAPSYSTWPTLIRLSLTP
jgi:hypothetical protein